MKYVKPKSVTWWAGMALIVMGALVGINEGFDLGATAKVINAWTGNLPAAVLLAQGAGLIGIRGALK